MKTCLFHFTWTNKRPDPTDRADERFYQDISGNVENKRQYDAHREKYKKEPVLFRVDRSSLHREHERSGKPRKYVDKNKIDDPHVG